MSPGPLARTLREALLRRAADRSGRFVVADEPRPCVRCGEQTRYVEIGFEAYLHPGACEEAESHAYFRALVEEEREREDR